MSQDLDVGFPRALLNMFMHLWMPHLMSVAREHVILCHRMKVTWSVAFFSLTSSELHLTAWNIWQPRHFPKLKNKTKQQKLVILHKTWFTNCFCSYHMDGFKNVHFHILLKIYCIRVFGLWETAFEKVLI